MKAEHKLTFQAQPIADQWMAKCSCGWRSNASLYEFSERDVLLAELRNRFEKHVADVQGENMTDNLRYALEPDDKFVITCDASYYAEVAYAKTIEEARLAMGEIIRNYGAHYSEQATICIAQIVTTTSCAVQDCHGMPEISANQLRT